MPSKPVENWESQVIHALEGILAGLAGAAMSDPEENGVDLNWESRVLQLLQGIHAAVRNAPTQSSSVLWGSIGGILSDQADLRQLLQEKAAIEHQHAAEDIANLQPAVDAIVGGSRAVVDGGFY